MTSNRKGQKEKNPTTPGFEPQATQCLVGATLSSPPGGMDFLKHLHKPRTKAGYAKARLVQSMFSLGGLGHALKQNFENQLHNAESVVGS